MYTYTAPTSNVLPKDAQNLYEELLKENHLLIGGVTGSGKSVLLNGLMYQAMQSLPGDVPGGKQFILIDPKQMELVDYQDLPHTLEYVNSAEAAVSVLESAVDTINRRNAIVVQNRRNGLQKEKKFQGSDIYILIDEMASLMLCDNRKVRSRIVSAIQTIGQIGRAAKVHLIACTQRPTQDVIPGKISVNIDARVGLRVRSSQESRNLIDQFSGCQNLPRYGFAYIHTPSRMKPEKVSVPMVDEEELWNRAQEWARQKREADAESAAVFARMVAEAEAAEAAKVEAVAETAEPEAVEVSVEAAEVPAETVETVEPEDSDASDAGPGKKSPWWVRAQEYCQKIYEKNLAELKGESRRPQPAKQNGHRYTKEELHKILEETLCNIPRKTY